MLGRVTISVGGQFGSEAKGKVASFIASEFDIAVRTGSPNAGHTVIHNSKIYKLHQIPSTFVNPKCILCIGSGALINPSVLKREVNTTQTKDRIFIDPQAGIIENKHIGQEIELVKLIGSTGQGCGAALIERILRKDFKLAKDVLTNFQIQEIATKINYAINRSKNVLVEGTQGLGLSLYHGMYPYVTSRDTTASNFLAEAGISPRLVQEIILVIRTFPIRVAGNSGPLRNEISWKELSRRVGKRVYERTTTTEKTRRVAEFDLGIVRKAILINRPNQIALQFLNYLYPNDENINNWDHLSAKAKMYIKSLETELNVPITLIGTGRSPEAMIDRRNI